MSNCQPLSVFRGGEGVNLNRVNSSLLLMARLNCPIGGDWLASPLMRISKLVMFASVKRITPFGCGMQRVILIDEWSELVPLLFVIIESLTLWSEGFGG